MVISVDQAVAALNRMLEKDRRAISRLVASRTPCNDALVGDSTAQVHQSEIGSEIGLLGVLNGVFGAFSDGPRKGWGMITAVQNDDGTIEKFELTENA